MSILHFTLGFPPDKRGGLVKSSIDLAIYQSEFQSVYVMWPGHFGIFNRKSCLSIKTRKESKKLYSVELVNPLPVCLFGGINDFRLYERDLDIDFIPFLKRNNVKKIYIHTFMGMPKRLLVDAKKLGIYIVYLTHNYFPFCPRSNLYFNHSVCNVENKHNCTACCSDAYSKRTLFLLQSRLYNKIKRNPIINRLRNNFYMAESNKENHPISSKKDLFQAYENLQNFYLLFFNFIDLILCNSYVSKEIYQKVLPRGNFKVVPLTHLSISDNRVIKMFNSNCITFGYLSPENEEKGFFFLIRVLDRLQETGKKFRLVIYGDTNQSIHRAYLTINGKYRQCDLKGIYSQIDCTIVPSRWKETYGFTVLESLSYGVPTIASSNVGASMLLEKENIFKNEDELFELLKNMNSHMLSETNKSICNNEKLKALIQKGLSWL